MIVETKTDSKEGWAWTRNGSPALGAIRFWGGEDFETSACYIEGVSAKTEQVLSKSGFRMLLKDALKFFADVLVAYGYVVIPPEEARDD